MNAVRLGDTKCPPPSDPFWSQPARWRLIVDGKPLTPGTPWKVESPFGSAEDVVVLDPAGKPVFDRPVYREAPNVNVVAWGYDEDGIVKVAVIRQPRQHSDEPDKPGENGHPPVTFGQLPMGFLAKIFGQDALERFDAGAEREVAEETGARVVLKVERPNYPWHNPNPSFVSTWSDLLFVQVDLKKVEALKHDRSEPIFSAEFITLAELRHRIALGSDNDGALYRMCTANSLWLIFLCTHPEFAKQMFGDI